MRLPKIGCNLQSTDYTPNFGERTDQAASPPDEGIGLNALNMVYKETQLFYGINKDQMLNFVEAS